MTTTSSTIASTNSNFFSAPSSLTKPTSTEGHGTALSKSILEWVFLVIAIVLLAAFLFLRTVQLRKRHQPLTRFFSSTGPSPSYTGRPQSVPRTGLPAFGVLPARYPLTPEMLYPSLEPLPSAYTRGQRTRAADTDEGGRRAGGADDDAKDMLPAYEGGGGPPKYMELQMMDSIRTRLHLNFAGVMGRETGSVGEAGAAEQPWDAPELDHGNQAGSSSPSHEPPTVVRTPPAAEPDPHTHDDDDDE
ncbi:hypothetical protein HWV62_6217 [Athelia sp. TMB]|nr:hypothetical protein HWV62_6217 [Athelia sp. TMB]